MCEKIVEINVYSVLYFELMYNKFEQISNLEQFIMVKKIVKYINTI